MMTGITDLCRNRWHGLLPHFGVSVKVLDGKQHPCPICGGRDRFRFDNKEGRGTYYCNHEGSGDGVQLVQLATGMSMRDTLTKLRELAQGIEMRKAPAAITGEQSMRLVRSIWGDSKRITEADDAGRYLASRGLTIPNTNALRFVQSLYVSGEGDLKTLPAMIAKICDSGGESTTLHRTYLLDGVKAPIPSVRRLMKGDHPKGCRIELCPPAEEMGIAEGIETALAVTKRFGIPCWSAVSSTWLKQFVPHPIVKSLVIFGDNDDKFGGQAAAYALAHTLAVRRDDLKVSVRIPEQPGSDWADTTNQEDRS